MKQRTALLLATALTLFATIGITAAVLASPGRQTEAANTETIPAVSSSSGVLTASDTSLSADWAAAYRAQIEQANVQLQEAYTQIQQLRDQNQELKQREELYRQRLEESYQAIQLLQTQVDQLSGPLAFDSRSNALSSGYEDEKDGEYDHDEDSAYEDDENHAYDKDSTYAYEEDKNHANDDDKSRVYEDSEGHEYEQDESREYDHD